MTKRQIKSINIITNEVKKLGWCIGIPDEKTVKFLLLGDPKKIKKFLKGNKEYEIFN